MAHSKKASNETMKQFNNESLYCMLYREKILNKLLILFLFLLPWQTIWIIQEQFLNGEKWQYGTIGFYATEGLLWGGVLLFIAWFWKKFRVQSSEFRFQISKDRVFVFSCLLFIVYCSLSYFWSVNKEVAFQQAFHILEAFLLFFILYLGPLKFTSAAKAFICGSILPSILGIWQFLIQSTFASKFLGLTYHPVWESGTSIISGPEIGRWLRAYGSLSHPNVFGGYLVVAIIFTLLLLWKKRGTVGMEHRFNGLNRLKQIRFDSLNSFDSYSIFLYAVFFLQMTALFFTFSRSAWIAFGIVSLFYCFIVFKSTNKEQRTTNGFIFSSLFLVVFLVFSFFPLVQTRLGGQTYTETLSATERISGYHEAWGIFKEHPWVGVGVGNYTAAAFALNPDLPGYAYQPAHNVPLLFLVEVGIIGTLLFVFVILSIISYLLSLNNKSSILLLIPYALLLLFDHYLFSSYIGLMLGGLYFGLTLDKKVIL